LAAELFGNFADGLEQEHDPISRKSDRARGSRIGARGTAGDKHRAFISHVHRSPVAVLQRRWLWDRWLKSVRVGPWPNTRLIVEHGFLDSAERVRAVWTDDRHGPARVMRVARAGAVEARDVDPRAAVQRIIAA